jgi:hypothetical protein
LAQGSPVLEQIWDSEYSEPLKKETKMLEDISFERKILSCKDNRGKNLGLLEYEYSVPDSQVIIHLRVISVNNIAKLTTPTIIRDAIEVIVGFFEKKNTEMVEFLVRADNPVEFACRAFCEIMGGNKSEKVFFHQVLNPFDNSYSDIRDDLHTWEEFIITKSGYKGQYFCGTIDDIVKTIVHKTNILKRQLRGKGV